MARPLRYEAAGAVYHVMARGEGGKDVFEDDSDRKVWLERLGEVCGSTRLAGDAWVMMGNHPPSRRRLPRYGARHFPTCLRQAPLDRRLGKLHPLRCCELRSQHRFENQTEADAAGAVKGAGGVAEKSSS